jgi:hypothetical protein
MDPIVEHDASQRVLVGRGERCMCCMCSMRRILCEDLVRLKKECCLSQLSVHHATLKFSFPPQENFKGPHIAYYART